MDPVLHAFLLFAKFFRAKIDCRKLAFSPVFLDFFSDLDEGLDAFCCQVVRCSNLERNQLWFLSFLETL